VSAGDRQRPDLDALEALAAAASPGPWCMHPNGTSVWTGPEYDSDAPDQVMVLRCAQKPDGGLRRTIDDLEFVIEAREAVPALIARVRELEAVKLVAEFIPLKELASATAKERDMWRDEFLKAAKYVEENARLHAEVRRLERLLSPPIGDKT
jgi:hypothetical protein